MKYLLGVGWDTSQLQQVLCVCSRYSLCVYMCISLVYHTPTTWSNGHLKKKFLQLYTIQHCTFYCTTQEDIVTGRLEVYYQLSVSYVSMIYL